MANSVQMKRSQTGARPQGYSCRPGSPRQKPSRFRRGCAADRANAYELYEQRGMRNGHAPEDWLEAEAIVMGEIHEARE